MARGNPGFVDFFKTTIFGVLHGILRIKPPCLSAFSSTKTDPGLSSTRRQKNVPQSGLVFVKDVISCGGFVQMTFSVEKQRNLLQGNGKKPMCGHICTPTKTTNFTKFLHSTTLFERFPAMLGSRRKKLTLPESKIVLDKKASQKESIVFQPSILASQEHSHPSGFHFSTPFFHCAWKSTCHLPPFFGFKLVVFPTIG